MLAAALRRALVPARTTPSKPIEYTPLLVGYVAILFTAAAITAALTLRAPVRDPQTLIVVGVAVFVMSRLSVRPVSGVEYLFSATVMLHMGASITFGALGALISCFAECLGFAARSRIGWFRFLFNVSQIFLTNVIAWGAYTTVLRADLPAAWRVALAGVAMGGIHWATNHVLLAGIIATRDRQVAALSKFAREAVRLLPYSAMYGISASAFPFLYAALGTLGALSFFAPLLAAQLFLIALSNAVERHSGERQSYIELVEAQNERLDDQRLQVVRAYDQTLIALTNALDARDRETEGHSRRVVEFSRAIAVRLGMEGDALRILSHGALLHDIGKIGIPDNILLKPAKLTEEEWELMRRHPEIGEAMVRDVEVLREARRIILHHHERWNGAGYPRGLRGKEIDPGARIFAVADAADALTHDRPYRRAVSIDEARAEIARCRAQDFDPDAADAFLALPEEEIAVIMRLRTPPGLDLLYDAEARARYLASIGLGVNLVPA